MAQRPHYTAHLNRVSDLSRQTKHFEFEVTELETFPFVAGQFISMVANNQEGKAITRAYSIASGPRNNKTFDLCLNRVEGGFFSNYLCDLSAGADVKFHGPHGLFVLRQPLRDLVMVATGTGVAPMRSFVDWIFESPERHEGRQIWLVYGTRYAEDIYYREEFERTAAKFPNFHYVVTLSRDQTWTGERGYVQAQVAKIVGQRTDMDAYICGLNDMVSANRTLLTGIGWDKKQIVFERYD